jgi:4,5-dihydroxyphthalate decarboxylase
LIKPVSHLENTRMNETRRDFLRLGGALAGAALATGTALGQGKASETAGNGAAAGALEIRISGYPLDHVRALADGRVQVHGCDVTFEPGKIGDLNTHVFSGPRTLDVTEIGLSPFMLAYANEGFRAYSLIPVFPIRLFRHKSVFIHTDRGIERPQDLKGRRIGTPGYSSTSLTWIRGFMQHEYGVEPQDVEWVVSAEDSSAKDAGKVSAQESVLPEGISVSVGPEGKDESDLLLDGEVDALFHAGEPKAFTEGHPKVRRLFEDPRATERDYFARTGIFPIMHAVAMRNDLIEAHPWLPKAVFEAYSRAKRLRYEEMRMEWLMGTLPWFGQELDETRALMGDNFWPYGIGKNEKTLNALFQYSYEQGLAKKQLMIEELFHPSTLELTES